MLIRSFLLRISLCLVLALDGITVAMASTQMAALRVEAWRSPAEAERTAPTPPCHDSAESTTQVAMSESARDARVPAQGGATDCCASASCPCTCVQHAYAAVPAGLLLESFASQLHDALAPDPGHADASRRQLIRPPIG